jgi:hypothetical protein
MWKEKLSKNFKFVPKQQSSSFNGRGDRTIQVLIKIKKENAFTREMELFQLDEQSEEQGVLFICFVKAKN